ncbi:long-chain fatty acid--CoA ligase [soil metagenome]
MSSDGEPTTVPELLAGCHTRWGDRAAFAGPGGELSFAELGSAAGRTAAWMIAAGANAGDRIVLALATGPDSRVLEWGILEYGFVRVAVSARLHPREIAAIALDCAATLVFCGSTAVDAVLDALLEAGSTAKVIDPRLMVLPPEEAPHPNVQPGDLAMIIYSSGSSGTPKGATVTNRAWLAQSRRAMSQLPELDERDLVLAVAQLPHFGGSIALNCATSGATTLFLERFDAAGVADLIDANGVTVVPLATTMLERLAEELLARGSRLASLRAVPYGGSAIPARFLHRAVTAMPGVLVQFYGLAEALAPLSALTAGDHEDQRALASAGRWLPGTDYELRDDGLAVRGEVVMPGYVDGTGVDADGWFATGDRATFADGFLYLEGRIGDSIATGGFTVEPREVETAIAGIPEIADVAVIGLPNPLWGEGVTAVIQLRDPAAPVSLEQLQAACRAQLAGYKKPVAMYVVPQMPHTIAGKPDRARLRREFGPTP